MGQEGAITGGRGHKERFLSAPSNSDNAVHTGGARPRGEAAGRAPHSLRRPEQGLAPCLSLGFLTCEMEYLGPGKSAQRRWSPPPRTRKARHSLRAAEGSGRRGLLERTPEQTSLPHQCKRGSVGHDRRPVIRPRGHAATLQPTAGVRPRAHAPYCWISTCRPSARRETVSTLIPGVF